MSLAIAAQLTSGMLVSPMPGKVDTADDRPGVSGASSAIRLDLAPGPPGAEADARLSFDPADGVRGFNLLFQFEPGRLLAASAADFQRNATFFPSVVLGDQELNRLIDVGAGSIRIVGLAPVPSTDRVELGQLRLHVAPNAVIGATQTITVSGEINDAALGVVAIEPATAVFQVAAPGGAGTPTPSPGPVVHPVYLPLIYKGN